MKNIKKTLIGLVLGLSPLVNAQSPIWKEVELITPENAQIKYGETIPVDVYTSLDTFFSEVNSGNETLRANIESGLFTSTNGYLATKPFAIKGVSPNQVTIDSFIVATDYAEIENVKSNGNGETITGGNLRAFVALLGGGKIQNCDLYNEAIIGINPSYDFILENNTFNAVQSSTADVAVSFTAVNQTTTNGNLKIANNDFYNVPKVFYLNKVVNAGVTTSLDSGGNYFENCDIVVDNPFNYNQDFTSNAWADNNLTRSQPTLITNPQYILENKVINAGNGIVDVSNPLNYNPMELRDRDGDGDTDYQERVNGTDEFNPLSKSVAVPINALSLIFTSLILGSLFYKKIK